MKKQMRLKWFGVIYLAVLALLLPAATDAQLVPNLGGQRAGISALTFLKMDVSPRAAGMGGAQIAMLGDAYAIQWNPAAIADVKGTSFAASNNFWVAGINHSFFSAAFPRTNGNGLGSVFGVSFTGLSAGAMERRTETQPNGTGEYFSAYDVAAGLTYAKWLTEHFSFGVTAKYVNETLDQYVARTATVDLGFLYRLDWKGMNFAVNLQNFGPNSRLQGPGFRNGKQVNLESYPTPTVFSLGISMMPVKTERHNLTTVLQLNHPNDNAENIRLGVEYNFHKFLFLRTGYKINVKDQTWPTLGAGLRMRMGRHSLFTDYSVDPMPYLGWRHRIGLSLVFNKPEPPREAPETIETPSVR